MATDPTALPPDDESDAVTQRVTPRADAGDSGTSDTDWVTEDLRGDLESLAGAVRDEMPPAVEDGSGTTLDTPALPAAGGADAFAESSWLGEGDDALEPAPSGSLGGDSGLTFGGAPADPDATTGGGAGSDHPGARTEVVFHHEEPAPTLEVFGLQPTAPTSAEEESENALGDDLPASPWSDSQVFAGLSHLEGAFGGAEPPLEGSAEHAALSPAPVAVRPSSDWDDEDSDILAGNDAPQGPASGLYRPDAPPVIAPGSKVSLADPFLPGDADDDMDWFDATGPIADLPGAGGDSAAHADVDPADIDLMAASGAELAAPGSGFFEPLPPPVDAPIIPAASMGMNSDALAPPGSGLIGSSHGGSDVIRGVFKPGQPPASNIFDDGPGYGDMQHTEPMPIPADGGDDADVIRTPPPAPFGRLVDAGSDVFDPARLSGSRGPTAGGSSAAAGNMPNTSILDSDQIPKGPDAVQKLLSEMSGGTSRRGTAYNPSDAGSGADGTPDFDTIDTSGSGSNLFADSTSPDYHLPGGSSGVNVLGALGGPPSGVYGGPASSIFTDERRVEPRPEPGEGVVDVSEIPLMGSTDDATEAFALPDEAARHVAPSAGPPSGDAGRVSFDMPGWGPTGSGDAARIAEASGMIDWSLPAHDEDLAPGPLPSDVGTIFGEGGNNRSSVLVEDPDGFERPAGTSAARRGAPPARSESRPSIDDLLLPAGAPELPPPSMILSTTTPMTSSRFPQGAPSRAGLAPAHLNAGPAPEPVTIRRGGWLAGGAAGLLAGLGAGAAAYFGGLLPAPNAPLAALPSRATAAPAAAPADPLATAQSWLAGGNAKEAVKALEALPATAEPPAPAVQLARGQALWLARVQELAPAGAAAIANDDQFAKAEADLKAVSDGADAKAAAQALLQIGLAKEVRGEVEGARAVYSDGAARFPKSKKMFDAALDRLRAVAPARGERGARLIPPRTSLAPSTRFVRLTLTAEELQDPPAPAPADDEKPAPEEPGGLFWRAVNLASAGRYAEARAAAAEAKKLHEARRLANVGRGLNPLTDPFEQIFSKACDELSIYWQTRADLYGHPVAGPLARRNGVRSALDTLAAAETDRAKLRADVTRLNTDVNNLTNAVADGARKLDQSRAELTKAGGERTKLAESLDAAKKELETARADLKGAADSAAAARAKLQASEATVAAAAKVARDAGLLGPNDDPAAKLPAALKVLATTGAGPDKRKAAEALQAALRESDSLKRDVAAANAAAEVAKRAAEKAVAGADERVAAAKAEGEAARADLAKKLEAESKGRAADRAAAERAKSAEVAAAARKAAAEAEERLAAGRRALEADAEAARREARDAEARRARELAEQASRYEAMVADARQGVKVPLLGGESAARQRAERAFAAGLALWEAGRPSEAEPLFEKATAESPNDARFWYFLGLTKLARGDKDGADAALKRGADQEAKGRPGAEAVGAALERVQGPARRALAAYRP